MTALAPCLAAPPAFAPVTPGRALVFPLDFGAHPDFRTEWWYVTGWLVDAKGKPLGFQLTFFRSATGVDAANPSAFAPRQLIIGHAALSDPAIGKLVHAQQSAREGFGLAYAKAGATDIKLDDWRMVRGADGYTISVKSAQLSLQLQLQTRQPPLPQGQGGYSRKGPKPENASYYYSEPQLAVRGSVVQAGAAPRQVSGSAWFDHEWSSAALDPDAAGWDWVGANLDDGSALMAFQIRDRRGAKLWAHATVRTPAGQIIQYGEQQVAFAPQASWRSPRTGVSYPVATLLTTGSTGWRIAPLQQDQELDARRSTGALYWEGAVTLEGLGPTQPAPHGRGYLEMTGYDRPMKL
ncbi:MAG: carotenoid 1,2-hydratase [Pseudomonadota bacterium]